MGAFRPGFLSLLLLVLASSCAERRGGGPQGLRHLEPGVEPPTAPELFGPALISTQHGERDGAFLPDQSAFYYTIWTGGFGAILETRRVGNGWSEPTVTQFSGRFSDLEPFVTADGNRLFFASNRPLEEDGEPKDYDIWFVERRAATWSRPIRLSENVNTSADEFYPSLDTAGNLYFTAAYDSSMGGEDIWMSSPDGPGFSAPRNVGPGVNTERDEFNALIAPDGGFLVFSSFGRDDGLGGGDLYISFRNGEGQLGPAVNAGPDINSESLDFSPALTPDGRSFLFSSRRSNLPSPTTIPWSYPALTDALSSPGNGNLDIYIVDASFITRAQEAFTRP